MQCILGGSPPQSITMFWHFSDGGQELADFLFAGCTVSVMITQLCHHSMKVAVNNTKQMGIAVFQ